MWILAPWNIKPRLSKTWSASRSLLFKDQEETVTSFIIHTQLQRQERRRIENKPFTSEQHCALEEVRRSQTRFVFCFAFCCGSFFLMQLPRRPKLSCRRQTRGKSSCLARRFLPARYSTCCITATIRVKGQSVYIGTEYIVHWTDRPGKFHWIKSKREKKKKPSTQPGTHNIYVMVLLDLYCKKKWSNKQHAGPKTHYKLVWVAEDCDWLPVWWGSSSPHQQAMVSLLGNSWHDTWRHMRGVAVRLNWPRPNEKLWMAASMSSFIQSNVCLSWTSKSRSITKTGEAGAFEICRFLFSFLKVNRSRNKGIKQTKKTLACFLFNFRRAFNKTNRGGTADWFQRSSEVEMFVLRFTLWFQTWINAQHEKVAVLPAAPFIL